jgi:hypothetical protein
LGRELDSGTALGPAILTSVALAANGGKPGSSVFVCTDGLANYGLGKMDWEKEDDKEYEKKLIVAKEFYSLVG